VQKYRLKEQQVTNQDLNPEITPGAQTQLQPTNYPLGYSSQRFQPPGEQDLQLTNNPAGTEPDAWLNREKIGDLNSKPVNRTGTMSQITEKKSQAYKIYEKYIKNKPLVSEEIDKAEEAEDAAVEKKEPERKIVPKKKSNHESVKRRIQGPNLKPEIQSWN